MILTLKPGEKFEVPVGSYQRIRFGTPFTAAELLAAELSILYTRNGLSGSWPASPAGTYILLEIEHDMLSTGFYAIKPQAIIDGKTRKYKKAIAMRVLGDAETT